MGYPTYHILFALCLLIQGVYAGEEMYLNAPDTLTHDGTRELDGNSMYNMQSNASDNTPPGDIQDNDPPTIQSIIFEQQTPRLGEDGGGEELISRTSSAPTSILRKPGSGKRSPNTSVSIIETWVRLGDRNRPPPLWEITARCESIGATSDASTSCNSPTTMSEAFTEIHEAYAYCDPSIEDTRKEHVDEWVDSVLTKEIVAYIVAKGNLENREKLRLYQAWQHKERGIGLAPELVMALQKTTPPPAIMEIIQITPTQQIMDIMKVKSPEEYKLKIYINWITNQYYGSFLGNTQ